MREVSWKRLERSFVRYSVRTKVQSLLGRERFMGKRKRESEGDDERERIMERESVVCV